MSVLATGHRGFVGGWALKTLPNSLEAEDAHGQSIDFLDVAGLSADMALTVKTPSLKISFARQCQQGRSRARLYAQDPAESANHHDYSGGYQAGGWSMPLGCMGFTSPTGPAQYAFRTA